MKQITLDWSTYCDEIRNARLSGFSYRRDVLADLEQIIKAMRDHDSGAFHAAERRLFKLIDELRTKVDEP